MADVRRVIRKLPRQAEPGLFDQLWPVNVALLVLGSFLLGSAVAYLRSDDPRWWANRLTWVLLIPLLVGAALVALRQLESRWMRRAVQLSAIVSILVHLFVMIGLLESHLFSDSTARPAAQRELVEPQRQIIVPEYARHHFLDPQQRPQEDYERPVETESPQTQPQEVARQESQPEPQTQEPQPTPVPESVPTTRPNVVQRQQAVESVPRHSEQSSQLSRRTASAQVRPNQTVDTTQATTTPATAAAANQPGPATSVARQPAAAAPAAMTPAATPAVESPANPARQAPNVARRTSDSERPPTVTSAATLPRPATTPQTTPRATTVVADAPATTQRTINQPLQPRSTLAQRQTTASPSAQPTPAAAVAESSPTLPATQRREQVAESRPTLAQTPTPVAGSRVRATSRPDAATVADTATPHPTTVGQARPALEPAASTPVARAPATAAPTAVAARAEPVAVPARPTSTPAPAVAARAVESPVAPAIPDAVAGGAGRRAPRTTPNTVTNAADVATNAGPQVAADLTPAATATSVARQPTGSAGVPVSQPPLEAQAASPANQLAQSPARRAATASAVPSLDPQVVPGSNPSRTMTTAAAAASPTNVESPAAAIAATGDTQPTAQPVRLAMSRATAGVVGAGVGANLDRASPAGERPALTASGSARRAESQQTAPEGPALAPSDPALVRRSVAGASRPSATLRAENVEYATVGGAKAPGELNASASAAVVAANSNAARGQITGAKGSLDVDLGPTQIVAEQGTGRASGGGQGEINFADQSQMVARSRAGGAPQAAIAATNVAAVPVAPPGTTGGAPAAALQPLATATARTVAGGDMPATGGPTAGQTGPPAEVALAPTLADSTVSRADAAQLAGGKAGDQPALNDEDEDEKRRRLARAGSGGAAHLALQGPANVELPATGAEAGGTPTDSAIGPALAASRAAPTAAMVAGASGAAATDPSQGQTAGQLAGSQRIARAEAVDAAVGNPVAGGGTGSPNRSSSVAPLTAATRADVPSLAGAPQSGGVPQGAPLEAQGLAATRAGEGVRAAAVAGPVGAVEAPVALDGRGAGEPSSPVASRTVVASPGDTPVIGQVAAANGNVRRQTPGSAATAVGTSGPVEVPDLPAEVAQANADHLGAGMARSATGRQAAGAATSVDLAAVDGPGGLGSQVTPDVGLNTRRAQADSTQVDLRAGRFQRQKSGGVLSTSTAAVVPTDPFRNRAGRSPGQAGGNGSPPPQTEEAIELGLAFLARHQSPDGSWSLRMFNEDVVLSSDTAATALAVLAFQGAGYHHREHKYKDNVRAALDYLVKNQKDDGDLFLPVDDESNRSVWLYSHSIAALALSEAYGMTQDPALQEPAQKAIDFIVNGQERERGGWRYAPGVGADTSVTGWMMMALKSGELANLKVPPETYARIRHWLDMAQASPRDKHLYRYNPYAPDTDAQRHGRSASKTMTAVGLLMRMYTGWKRDNPDLIRGADYLAENPPATGTPRNPQRDTYYWYYATQVMFHVGGEHWKNWNAQLHPLLTQTQIRQGVLAGSWDPRGAVPDRWAPHAGRLYVTVLNLLSLEVYYRHLPLYDDAAR